ncbi:MAG: YlbF family regulator [Christensenellales bacterium]|jgi:cell fate (sporulation/competence/biofilm development) regulator YlbF (YheA/YmcA/DUF963 family)
MDILDKAIDLGKAIAESDTMKTAATSEAALMADEEALGIWQEYQYSRSLVRELAQGQDGKALDDAVEKLTKVDTKIRENETVQAYIKGQADMQLLIRQVNAIISKFIKGDDSGCSNDCSSCGGCG